MILVIALIAISIWAVAATAVEVHRDGYGPTATDWSRVSRHG